jgi:hypothetical protein
MVRSLRTTVRFFHQRIRERAESLQERCAFVGTERREGLLERPVAPREPLLHACRGARIEVDDGAAPVVRVLPPLHETVALELRRELARRRERQPDRPCEVADSLSLGGRDLCEQRHVAAAERRLAAHQRDQLG